MSSAARSNSPQLSGPVAVCVDRPLLALDRPFTYELPHELEAGVGSLVQVRFHGKAVRAWVLGPTSDVPSRVLPVVKRMSPVRLFDERLLALYRWMSERYVSPLAAVVARAIPPRVVGEEVAGVDDGADLRRGRFAPSAPFGRLRAPAPVGTAVQPLLSDRYSNGARLLGALREGSGTFLVRTAPGDDAALAVECVRATLDAGRAAIVVVPEVDPVPVTVAGVVEAFGDDVACFFGLGKRARYRMWLDILGGRYRVVVGTRAAVFAPVGGLGLVYVAREHHSLHREERAPYFHAREVAAERGRVEGAVCVLASVMPSLEALAVPHEDVEPRGRRRWPPVEVVKPGPEGRAPRLVRAIREARRGFLYEPLRGYGVARVCRACGETAACAACGGTLRSEAGSLRCVVCESRGRCASCGAADFGVARGGAERVEEWARGLATVAVSGIGPGDPARAPGAEEVVVGGIDAVKDVGAHDLDLVGILNADASLHRAGVGSRGRALAAWAEAAAWAAPAGRVIVQSSQPNDPAIQALVSGRPERFARAEVPRLADAGFPVASPVFRVTGTDELEAELTRLRHRTLLVTTVEEQTICLVALDPVDLTAFGRGMRRLAERGVVTRVEAEPHL